eukprot:TRINITY_DN69064_c0_g1_i1.p1 TRINITY_DN69064_c0_g1~~TRINITY_DN69064_c0_g1_i1.p1  ORF type:complete len:385 (+),score=37.30 TRINITY_DN69064_c0_g1_i1:64-1218(+)
MWAAASCYSLLFFLLDNVSGSALLRKDEDASDIPLAAGQALRNCGLNDYAHGRWKEVGGQTSRRTFVCCSWDNDAGRGDSTVCANRRLVTPRKGASMYAATQERATTSLGKNRSEWPIFKFAPIGGHACACSHSPSQPGKMLPIERFTWQPASCSLDQFSAARFCQQLRGRSIALAGDSTMAQAGSSLINSIIGDLDGTSHDIGCARDVTVLQSDTLVALPVDRTPATRWTSLEQFATEESITTHLEDILNEKFDIVVLGVGAWIQDELSYQSVLDRIAAMIRERRAQPKPPVFLWKTVSGAGCGKVNEHAVLNEYDHALFPSYDAMAKKTMNALGVEVIDMSMLYLRGDAHPPGDCLHFCSPGPLDVFARILLHHFEHSATLR